MCISQCVGGIFCRFARIRPAAVGVPLKLNWVCLRLCRKLHNDLFETLTNSNAEVMRDLPRAIQFLDVAYSQIHVNKSQNLLSRPLTTSSQRHDWTGSSLYSIHPAYISLIFADRKSFPEATLVPKRQSSRCVCSFRGSRLKIWHVCSPISWQENRREGKKVVSRCWFRVQDALGSH